jgi:hypothetical protein
MNTTESSEIPLGDYVTIPDVDPREKRERDLNIHYHECRLQRTDKTPLRFSGFMIVETPFSHEKRGGPNYAINVYKTAAGNYVALITESCEWEPTRSSTLTAKSLQELVTKLQAEGLIRAASYNEALSYALYQLSPDDSQYDETIE